MKLRLITLLAGAATLLAGILPAAAQESIKFALCYDITKAYSFVTPQVAQAARDYAELLNQKGGISGHPIEVIVQDHGNEPQRGIECYEKLKRECVMVTIPTLIVFAPQPA